jgi:hypothetical protein
VTAVAIEVSTTTKVVRIVDIPSKEYETLRDALENDSRRDHALGRVRELSEAEENTDARTTMALTYFGAVT